MKHFTSPFPCVDLKKIFSCCTWLMLLVMLGIQAQAQIINPYFNDDYCTTCSQDTVFIVGGDDGNITDTIPPCKKPEVSPNPSFEICESLRVLIIIDRSGSIRGFGGEQDVKNGVMAFIDGLVCEEVETAVMDFSDEARWIQQTYSSTSETKTRMESYFVNEFQPFGNTNWNHAFYKANHEIETPDLVLFFTDGNPTNWGLGPSNAPPIIYTFYPFDHCGSALTTEPPELYNAMVEANLLKEKGAHIFGMGVGDVEVDKLQDVTGTTVFNPGASGHTIFNTDYYIGDFQDLETNLADLVGRICPNISCEMDLPACPGESNGSIEVTVTVSGTYKYRVQGTNITGTVSGSDPGSNTFVINGLPAGDYTVEVDIVNNGCIVKKTCSSTVTSLQCEITHQVNIDCFGESDGTVTVKGSGGTGNYQYSIDGDNWKNDGNFQGLSAGTYEVQVRETDGNKCVSICEVTITQPPALTCEIEASGILTCAVTEVTLNLTTNASGASYSWTGPGITSSNKTSKNPKVKEPGEYTVEITDGRGCTKSCSVTVDQNIAKPDCGIEDAAVWTCYTTEMTLSGSSDTEGAIFSWRAGQGGSFSGRTDISNPTITAPGKYYLTVTDPSNGCSSEECEITIQADTISPDCNIEPPVFLDCDNPTTTLVGSTNISNAQFKWTASEGGSIREGENSATPTIEAPGKYTLTVTNPENGCSSTCVVTVDGDLDLPSCSITGGKLTCETTSITLILETDASDPIYNWSGPGIISGADSPNPVVNQPGNYHVEVKDGITGCPSSCSVLVTQEIRTPSCSATGGVLTCNDETLTLSVTTDASNPVFSWTGPSIVSGADTQNPVVDAPGTYEVTITDGTTGCVKTCTALVTVDKTDPHCDAGPDMILTCEITQVTLQGSSTTEGASFSWSTTDGNIESGGSTATPTVNAPGIYKLTVTAPNGCTSECEVEVTGNTGKPDCNAGPDMILTCEITQVTLQGSSTTADATFSWSTTDGNIVSGGSTATPTVNAPGIYKLTVTAPNGCTSTCEAVVSEPDPMNCEINLVKEISGYGINDGEIEVIATGGLGTYLYSIDGGTTWQTTGVFIGLGSGTHVVTVKDEHECSTTCQITLGQPGELLCDISVNNHVSCFGGNDGKITVTTTGGVPPISFSLNGGTPQSSGEFTGLSAGTYVVTVEDANGNTSSCQGTITQPDPLELSCVSDALLCNGDNNGILSVTVTGGTAPFTYAWVDVSNPSVVLGTEAQIEGLSAGNYQVTVTDANDCESSCEASVTEPAPLDMTVEVNAVSCYEGDDGMITATATGGVGGYEYSIDGGLTWQTSGQFGGLSEGTYTILVKDENDCQLASDQIAVGEPELLTCNIELTSPITGSGLANGVIEVTASGGVGSYEFSIDGGTTWQSSGEFTDLGAGTHIVMVRDENECTSTCQITLGQPEELVCDITVNNHVSCFGGNDGKITVTTTGGVPPISFSLNGGTPQSSGEFTGLSEGAYVVTVEDENGNSSTCEVTITEPEPLVLSCVSDVLLCNGDNNGILSVTVTGGTAPFTYAWVDASNPDVVLGTESQIEGLSAGSYQVIVTDANGCESSCDASVTEPAPLDMTVEVNAVSCYEGDDGMITATATGGVGGYEYSIDGGLTWQTSGQFGGLSEGTYTILVKDENDCQLASDQIAVGEPELLTCNIELTSPVTGNGLANGEIEVTATGGVGEYEFSIDGGATWQPSGEFTGLGAGEYTVIVRDGNECTSSCLITLGQPDELICDITVENHVSCFDGADGKIFVTATGGVPPISFSLNGGTPQSSGEFTGLSAGTYVVTVEDANGNTSTCQVVITQPDPPTVECPDNKEMVSCLTQSEIDVAFSDWLALFKSSCECTLMEEADLSQYSAPDLCGGEVTVTYYVVDFCGNRAECSATFTVNPPAELEVHSPQDYFAGSCESQEDVNSAFATWLTSFSHEGGCNPVFTDLSEMIAPDVCAGDTLTVTYTVQDHCQGPITRTAQFGVEKAPELTVTCSDPVYLGSCTSQAEIDAAFSAWISGFGYDGGCGVQVTGLDDLTAPDWCVGDTIVVTYTATDVCGQEVSCESAFGVERTPELTVTCSDPVYIGSCTSQAEIDAAFSAWISGFGYDGGCGVQVTGLDDLTAPDWCVGDTIVVTYTAIDACGQEVSCESAFGVERTPELTVTCSDPVYLSSCTSQAEIDAAFSAWISGFGFDGGCSAEVTDLSELTAPDWCAGDTIVVTYTAIDACGQEVSCESVFGVERTPELIVSCSAPVYIGSCTSQEEIDAAFTAWIDGFGFDRGCGATATDLSSLAAPNWCEGDTIVVTYIATDACGQEVSCESAFGVERTPELTVSCSDDVYIGSCTSQEEIDAAFRAWIDGFGFDGGCGATATDLSSLAAPNWCEGDTIVVTYIATDDCGQEVSCTSSFGVERRQELVIYCPEDITLDACARQADIDAAFDEWIAQFTFSGGCHAEASDLSEYTAPEQCSGESVTVFYSVWDACGQEVSCSATFTTIKDEEPPVIVLEAFRQVPCCTGLSQQFEVPEIFDNCDEDLEISYVTELYYAGAYECKHRRTWTATDACGNTTTATQIVEIIDHTAPVLIPVHPSLAGMESGDTLYLDCDESISLKKDAFALEDDCAPCPQRIEIEMDRYVTEGECGNGNNILQTQVVEWRATDKYGETTRFKIYVVKADRQGPEFVSVPRDKKISCDEEVKFGQPVVEDACSEVVALTYEDVTGQDTEGRTTYTRTWTAEDGCGNYSTASQTITMGGSAPVFTYIPEDKTVSSGAEIKFDTPSAGDGCGEVIVEQVGEDEVSGDACGGKTYTRTWKATAENGMTATASQTISEKGDDVAPVFQNVPADLVLPCGTELPAADIRVTDNNGAEVTVTEDITINGEGCDQEIIRTWTATDACGNSASVKQYIWFADNAGITFTHVPSNASLNIGDELPQEDALAESNCTEGKVNIEVEDVVVEDEACSKIILRHFIATDGCDHRDTALQYIVMTDDVLPEVVVAPQNKIVSCGEAIEFDEPEFYDNVGIDTIRIRDTAVTDECEGGYHQRIWEAVDFCGNTMIVSQRITVIPDREAPVFASEDSVLLIGWFDADPEFEPVASDNCSSEVTITKEETVSGTDCVNRKLWTWTATDDCGNTSTLTWEIIRRGEVAGEFDHVPSDFTVECPSEAVFDSVSIINDRYNEVNLTYQDMRGEGDCFTGYELTRVWTATDGCNNEKQIEQRIFVMGDTTAPVISDVPADMILECGEELPVQDVTVSDNCGVDTVITEVDLRPVLPDTCADSTGHYVVRRWIAVDECGNRDTATQYIAVLGAGQTSLLAFIDVPATKVVYCEEDVKFEEPFAKSTCGEVEYSSKDHTVGEPCSAEYKKIREWIATDTCGNSISTYQTVIIRQDTIAPELVLDQPVKYAGCDADSTLEFDMPVVWDHCSADLVSVIDTTLLEEEGLDSVRMRTWTYQDACGNTASVSQELRYGAFDGKDMFANDSDTVYVDCRSAMTAYVPEVFTCDPFELSYEDTSSDSSCVNQLTIVRTWSAIDTSGRTGEYVQTFVIHDTIPPVIDIVSDTIYMTQMEYDTEGALKNLVSVTDDCGEVTTDITASLISEGDLSIYDYQVSAEDECGNVSHAEFVVVISASPVVPDLNYVNPKVIARVNYGKAPYSYVWNYQGIDSEDWIKVEEKSDELDVRDLGPVRRVRLQVTDSREQVGEKVLDMRGLEIGQKANVTMHPNPATSYLELRMNLDKVSRIELYDLLGHRVKTFEFDEMHDLSRVQLDIRDIPLGSYVVRIHNGQDVITRQLVKVQ